MSIDYEGRRFRAVENSASGEVSEATVFEYHQRGSVVWATYHGGDVTFGTLIATADDEGRLDMRYSHANADGVLMTGVCQTTPERLPDGRLRLHERWRWTSGSEAHGTSTLEEIN